MEIMQNTWHKLRWNLVRNSISVDKMMSHIFQRTSSEVPCLYSTGNMICFVKTFRTFNVLLLKYYNQISNLLIFNVEKLSKSY